MLDALAQIPFTSCFSVLAILHHLLTDFGCDTLCHPLEDKLTMLWLWHPMRGSPHSLLWILSSLCLGSSSQETHFTWAPVPHSRLSLCALGFLLIRMLLSSHFLGLHPKLGHPSISPCHQDIFFILLGLWHHTLSCRYLICISWTLHLFVSSLSLFLPIIAFLTLRGLSNSLPGLPSPSSPSHGFRIHSTGLLTPRSVSSSLLLDSVWTLQFLKLYWKVFL